MSPRFDIWRWDQVGFLDRVDENIQATNATEAIRRSQRARNGRLYVALPTDLTKRPCDSKGKVV